MHAAGGEPDRLGHSIISSFPFASPSPTKQGLLTGKYDGSSSKPVGPRAALITEGRYQEIKVLLDLLRKVGEERGGKTPAQVGRAGAAGCMRLEARAGDGAGLL